jgi:tetratricopeptide (TPR) repeat protein
MHGAGGTGKTVLTASFLLQSQEKINLSFPDGVLWVDLENNLADPLLLICDHIGLQTENNTVQNLRQQIAQHIRARSMRLLWIIDGGEMVADINPWLELVRNTHGKFIAIVRETPEPGWLSEYRANALKVGDLQTDEGLRLTENILRTALPADEISAWQELAQYVGYHPLALRILAACAFFDPTPQRWHTLLRDIHQKGTLALQNNAIPADDKYGNVHFSLSIGYERLRQRNPAAAQCFRILGILKDDVILVELVAQLVEPGENIGRHLANLAQLGFVEINRANNTYHFHRLLHVYAHTLLQQHPQEYQTTAERYVQAIVAHLPEVPADVLLALRDPLLDETVHAIEIAQRIGAILHATQIIIRIHTILIARNQADTVHLIAENLLGSISTQADQSIRELSAHLHFVNGNALIGQISARQAITEYAQVIEYSQHPALLFKAHINLAACYKILDQEESIHSEISLAKQCLESIPASEKAPYQQDYELTLQQLGWLKADPDHSQSTGTVLIHEKMILANRLIEDGSLSEARSLLESLEEELRPLYQNNLHFKILEALAHIYMKQSEYPLAERTLNRMEALLPNLHDGRNLILATYWQYRGWYAQELRLASQAQECLSKSLRFWQEVEGSENMQRHIRSVIEVIENDQTKAS